MAQTLTGHTGHDTDTIMRAIASAVDGTGAPPPDREAAMRRAIGMVDRVVHGGIDIIAEAAPTGIRLLVRRVPAGIEVSADYVRGGTGHTRVRISDQIYAYHHEGDVHVSTISCDIPDRWHRRWPRSEATIRRYIRRCVDVTGRITTLDA